MVKSGEKAMIKTSEEPVFVLAVVDTTVPEGGDGLSGRAALVSRPTVTQNGVQFFREVFFVEELESVGEMEQRKLAERAAIQQKLLEMRNQLTAEPELDEEPLN